MSFAQQLIDEGIEQGIEKGIEKGAFIGSIQQLQEIIGLPIQSNEALSTQKIPQLKKLNTQLRQQLNQKLS